MTLMVLVLDLRNVGIELEEQVFDGRCNTKYMCMLLHVREMVELNAVTAHGAQTNDLNVGA